ncbi:hypothetical protein C5167_009785 [Papaver somniferum]|uniref:Uncharacterized protein n=1 Tax=Papaver somniferum TaxID=3469 RepID=A0A4Y7K2F0_PAPSO|nr:hypothetical protein C5167_009785 [Papaver somniferum]
MYQVHSSLPLFRSRVPKGPWIDSASNINFLYLMSIHPDFHYFKFTVFNVDSPRLPFFVEVALACRLGDVCAVTSKYVSVRREVYRNVLVVPHPHLNGVCSFFLGEYANMILMRYEALHLTFVGPGACNKSLRPDMTMW